MNFTGDPIYDAGAVITNPSHDPEGIYRFDSSIELDVRGYKAWFVTCIRSSFPGMVPGSRCIVTPDVQEGWEVIVPGIVKDCDPSPQADWDAELAKLVEGEK